MLREELGNKIMGAPILEAFETVDKNDGFFQCPFVTAGEISGNCFTLCPGKNKLLFMSHIAIHNLVNLNNKFVWFLVLLNKPI